MPEALGLVAGQGDLPVELATRAAGEGRPLFVVRLTSLASEDLRRFPGADVPVERPGAVLAALKRAGCGTVVFGGKVTKPSLLKMKLDGFALKALALRVRGIWRHDDSLNRVVASIFEQAGIRVLGPAELWPDLLAGEGRLGGRDPSGDELLDIQAASEAARRVGVADRGQGAVARGGQVIAVEGAGHTEALLAKAADLPGEGGVLVKRAKPQQDRRLDLPVIGPETVAQAAQARLSGIAVEAGGAIMVRRAETIRMADAAGLFLLGLPRGSI
jgi:DUF1009 family protein